MSEHTITITLTVEVEDEYDDMDEQDYYDQQCEVERDIDNIITMVGGHLHHTVTFDKEEL